MYVSQLQASVAKYEANLLIKMYDKKGDGVLTKEELVGPTLFTNKETVPSLPKANDNPTYKISSNAHIKPNKQLRDEARKSSTRVFDRRASNIPLSREHVKEILKYHDSNKDGFLDVRELTKAFAFLGSILPFQKAHYGLTHADANKDGLISEVELDKVIDYANKVIKNKSASKLLSPAFHE